MGSRRTVAALIVFVLAFAPGHGGAAWSQTSQSSLDVVAAALRRSPVYVDPAAERALSDADAEQLAVRIRDEGEPVFIAVLPSSTAGTGGADRVVRDLVDQTGLSGTYAVVVGDTFRATSTSLDNADEIATAAFQDKRTEGDASGARRVRWSSGVRARLVQLWRRCDAAGVGEQRERA